MARVLFCRRFTVAVCSLVLAALLLALSTALATAIVFASARLVPVARSLVERPRLPAGQGHHPPGWWQRHVNEADGYSLALPPDWRLVPLEPPASPAPVAASEGQEGIEQRLADMARERAAEGVGMWAAAAPEGSLGSTTTVNVVRQPLGEGVAVARFAEGNLASLEEGGTVAGRVDRQWLSLSAGPALRVRADCRLAGDAGGRLLSITQVYMVHGRDGYVVTAVTWPERARDYAPIFEDIIRSLRWTT